MGDLFGGTDTSAQQAQISSNAAITALIERNVNRARADVLGLFPGAQAARDQATQAALGIFGQTIPQQLDVTQQASLGAQGTLLAGLPQFQNAILGRQVDLSGLQPQALSFDPSFAQRFDPFFDQESLPGPAVPGPSTPGPSTPGPAAPGPVAPGPRILGPTPLPDPMSSGPPPPIFSPSGQLLTPFLMRRHTARNR